MKFNISKEWMEKKLAGDDEGEIGAGNPAVLTEHMFGLWFTRLQELAINRGVMWLVGEPASHRGSFDEGLSPQDELDHKIAEATYNA